MLPLISPDPPPQAVALHHKAVIDQSTETVPFKWINGKWYVCHYPLHHRNYCSQVKPPKHKPWILYPKTLKYLHKIWRP